MGHHFRFFIEPSTGKSQQKTIWYDINSIILLAVPIIDSPLSSKPEDDIFGPLGGPLVWDYFLKAYQAILVLMELDLQIKFSLSYLLNLKPI